MFSAFQFASFFVLRFFPRLCSCFILLKLFLGRQLNAEYRAKQKSNSKEQSNWVQQWKKTHNQPKVETRNKSEIVQKLENYQNILIWN